MRHPLRSLVLYLFIALTAGASSLQAQAPACELLADALMKVLLADSGADEPLMSPSDQQATAPSAAGDLTSLISGTSFSELVSLAVDNNFLQSENDAVTINLNLFAFKAALQPEVIDQQSLYEQNEYWRRWGGAVTLGGKGEAFDRDGDGQEDPALEAKELGDIVTYELRYRFAGTRDRRDRSNVEIFFNESKQVQAHFTAFSNAMALFVSPSQHGTKLVTALDANGCVDRDKLAKVLKDPAVASDLQKIAATLGNLQTSIDAAVRRIDRRPVWTLVAGGTRRSDEFGSDKRMAALRGSLGGQDRGFTLNLEWNQTEGPSGAPDPTMWKGGLEYSILAFKDSTLIKDGLEIAFSGAYEMFDNVADAEHDTNAKLNAKLEFPFTKAVKVPISVTWANHKDLLEDEDEIRGHIGFTIDLSKLKDLKP